LSWFAAITIHFPSRDRKMFEGAMPFRWVPPGPLTMPRQGALPNQVVSGSPAGPNSAAAALLSYDVPRKAPWDWRVSLYTWTKGIAAGAYLAPLALALAGLLPWSSSLWRWAAPSVALAFLALTGLILILDLEHPGRFTYLFLRPQWRSWLVRGAVVITVYGAALALHLVLSATGQVEAQKWLAVVGLPAGVATAIYTAYLFAQARGRDLWQSPLLVPHLLVQALVLGAAVSIPFARWLADEAAGPLEWLLAGAALAHVLMALGEATLTHPTANARLAARELSRGRYAGYFWPGTTLAAVAILAPAIGIAAVPLALLAVLAHEHAYVQAGQAVPLA
jgi:formate-dependent nitrite reductase membrane component NrfD